VKQLNLQFVLGYTYEEFATSLRHIAEGKVDVTPLIAGHVGLER
jgi:threonine dehydrogenase-like Zn-dependent dehydrogenase